ncbi:MAG: hypothetical protein HYS34_02855 [Acidobacteria bacterium]|nr:hypothetical protein [Acidobacteriota bacterium]
MRGPCDDSDTLLACPLGDDSGKEGAADSPSLLTLELDFAAADRSLWGGGDWFSTAEYHALGKLTFGGVALRADYNRRRGTWASGLEMAARERSDGTVEVKVRATVNNPHDNEDRLVRVRLEVRNGGEPVQSGTIGPIDAEDDGNDVGGQTKLVIPAGALKTAPMTRLRLTLTAEED